MRYAMKSGSRDKFMKDKLLAKAQAMLQKTADTVAQSSATHDDAKERSMYHYHVGEHEMATEIVEVLEAAKTLDSARQQLETIRGLLYNELRQQRDAKAVKGTMTEYELYSAGVEQDPYINNLHGQSDTLRAFVEAWGELTSRT